MSGSAMLRQLYFAKTDIELHSNYSASKDSTKDAFIEPQPYDSWTLNETTCLWEAPVSKPDDGKKYEWNETTQTWDLDE